MKHHVPADFFVLRTPALPWDVAADWSDGLAAAQAFAQGDHSSRRLSHAT